METRLKVSVNRVGRQGLWKEEPVSSTQSGWGASFPITLSLFLAHRRAVRICFVRPSALAEALTQRTSTINVC